MLEFNAFMDEKGYPRHHTQNWGIIQEAMKHQLQRDREKVAIAISRILPEEAEVTFRLKNELKKLGL